MAILKTKSADVMIEASEKERAVHIGVVSAKIRGFVSFLDDRRNIVRMVCYAAAALLPPLMRHRRGAQKRTKAARRRNHRERQ